MSKRTQKKKKTQPRKLAKNRIRKPGLSGIDAGTSIEFSAGSLEIQAAADGEPESRPSFSMVAYRGGKLHLPRFAHPVVIDTRGVKIQANAEKIPILLEHKLDKPIGHGKPEIGARELAVSGTISQINAEAEQVVAASKNGFEWQASVGGRLGRPARFVQAGRRVSVNGRNFAGPVFVVGSFVWNETSVTSVGADEDRALTTIAAKGETMNEFEKWLEARGFNSADLSQEQEDALRADFDSQVGASAGGSEDADELAREQARAASDDLRNEITAESNRVFAINATANKYQGRLKASTLSDFRDQAMSGEITPEKFELECLKASREISRPSGIAATYSGASANTLTAALCQTAGIADDTIAASLEDEVGKAEAEKAMNEASAHRGFNLHKLLFASISAAGHSIPAGQMVDSSLIATALECTPKRSLTASAGQFSTISVPGILSRMANKAMLAAYNQFAPTALSWCGITDTNDTKEFERFRLVEAGLMEKLGPDGEIKHSALTEDRYSNKVETRGTLFGISEDDLMNDDMGAFLQIPGMIGKMGAMTLEDEAITLLVDLSSGSDPTDFFSSAPAADGFAPNYFDGAASALDLDSLGTAYTLFLDQVDSDGKPIMIEPGLLLVGSKNAITAGKLYNDSAYRFIGSGDRTETIDNQWRGQFRPLVSPHLSKNGATPNPDQWFLLPVPTDAAVVSLAFLRGQRSPQVASSSVDFNKLGVQFRGVFRFGLRAMDRRLGVKSKGKV